jgi:glycosyltransferase involved in cell wall biosynthesis
MINNNDVWLVVPVYNESEKIISVLKDILNSFQNIIVIDDGSFDNTYLLLKKSNLKISILRHVVNLGQGAALQTGIKYALNNNARFIITFDSDGQHQVKDALNLLNHVNINDYKIICGSRFLNKNNIKNIPFAKYVVLRLAVIFTKIMTGINVTDAHNGLRLITASAAKQVYLKQNRMSHATEIMFIIKNNNIDYFEIPVDVLYTDYSIKKGQKIFNLFTILFDLFLGKFDK